MEEGPGGAGEDDYPTEGGEWEGWQGDHLKEATRNCSQGIFVDKRCQL